MPNGINPIKWSQSFIFQNIPLIHRDLSWLQFNERVMTEAQTESNPLLERAKFLAISATNMDEFFMIRFPTLHANKLDKKSALYFLKIRNSVLESVKNLSYKQATILGTLESQLIPARIQLGTAPSPSSLASTIERTLFEEEVLPKLADPELFSPSKLNQLENLQIGVIYENRLWFRIPKSLPLLFCRWNEVSSELFCYFLDHILLNHLGQEFGLTTSPIFVRLTRDGDFTVDFGEEDTESIPDRVRRSLGSREKGKPTRLQYFGNPRKPFFENATQALRLISSQIIRAPKTLCLNGMMNLYNQAPEGLKSKNLLIYPQLQSIIPKPFRQANLIFDQLDHGDLLLHHPYDSFDALVEWIKAACDDPSVTQIEQTLYRMDSTSPILDALKKAAKTKTVRVIIELRARFDEMNNLRLAEELKAAGVEVAFGFGRLKIHGKVSLITRIVDGHLRRYAHLSTGNYKASTARQYTDLAILTSHPEIGSDMKYFFDRIIAGQIPQDFKRLISAPTRLHRRMLGHIDAEMQAAQQGNPARIFAKVNALVDETLIQRLYQASRAGVQVDLVVRGACSLVPGVKGLSENIKVISIVDRFLEHSRIYYFGAAKAMYLSSADWMPRNFFSRLELAFPILDPDIYEYIRDIIIPISLLDTVKARQLTSEGKWHRCRPLSTQGARNRSIRSQAYFEELARHEYEGTPLERKGLWV